MGMFPVQNYGEDFNKSMIGMGNFIAGLDKQASDDKQRGIENVNRTKLTDSAVARDAAATEHSQVSTEKIKREEADVKAMQKAIIVAPEFTPENSTRPKSKEALEAMADAQIRTQWLPNSLKDTGRYSQMLGVVQKGISDLAAAPPSDKPYVVKRSDGIQPINDVMDAHDFLFSDEKKQEHVNNGQIADVPKGTKYSIDKIEAYTFVSGKGTGAVTPWYGIVDGNGDPIVKPDGSPVLVPRTMDRSSNPEAKLDAIPLEALQAKVAWGKYITDAGATMTPEDAKYMEKYLHQKRVALGDKTAIRDDKPITLASGAKLVSSDGKTTLADNAKAVEPNVQVFSVREGNNIVSYQGDQRQSKSTWVPIGKSQIRKGGGMGGDGNEKLSPIALKIFDARTKAIEKLYTIEVGKPMVDPNTGETKIATSGDVASVTTTIAQYNKQLSDFGIAPYELPVADPDAKVKAWIDSEKTGEKPTKDATIKKELEKKGYSANKIAALLGNGSSGGMAPQSQQAQPVMRKMTAKDAQTAVGTFKTRNQAITALKNMGFTHDETGRPL